jgi:copper homeostasis protein
MQNRCLLEVCVESLDCAVAAEQGGAQRIELCGDLSVGGLTPALELMQTVRDQVELPIYAMIRPRAGNFCYTDPEFEAMQKEIAIARQLGMDGIVLGILDSEDGVDIGRTRELVDLARPLDVTFHRSFDESADLLCALEAVIQTGAKRILTSGGCASATHGAKTLSQLVAAVAGRVIIMPAGGIDAQNVSALICQSNVREVHASLGAAGLGRTARLSESSHAGRALSSQADGPLNAELLAFKERVRKLVEAISVIDEGAR